MAEDMSDIVKTLSQMLNNNNNNSTSDNKSSNVELSNNKDNDNDDFANNIKNILNNLSGTSDNSSEKESSSNNSNSNFDIDIGTILKIKSIMQKMNSKDDPRTNLLTSLKPYLNNKRKEKLDQYVKLLSMSKIIDVFNDTGGKN